MPQAVQDQQVLLAQVALYQVLQVLKEPAEQQVRQAQQDLEAVTQVLLAVQVQQVLLV